MRLLVMATAFAAVLSVGLPAKAAFLGSQYDPAGVGNINSLNQAKMIVEDFVGPPTSRFRATRLDFPENSNNISSSVSLSTFLGSNGTLLSGADSVMQTTVTMITGILNLDPGTYTFSVGSDDGYELLFGNQLVSQRTTNRGFQTDNTQVTVQAGDNQFFQLLYWENLGQTGLRFSINGVVVDQNFTDVPLPAGLPLMLAGLGMIAVWRRGTKA
ncbi:MAG: VPLPA-CTERM sorting domain-containing protein [Pseudomonadota bacterium]